MNALPPHRILALLLAAGKGTRMESTLPKPLIPLRGKPILQHLIDSIETARTDDQDYTIEIALILGHQGERIKEALGSNYTIVLQKPQRGTGHAVQAAKDLLGTYSDIIVFVGDSPLLKSETIGKLIRHHIDNQMDCTFLTAHFPVEYPYARVVRNPDGSLRRVVEARDAPPEEFQSDEYCTSHYIFRTTTLLQHLDSLESHADTGELYLTDMIAFLIEAQSRIGIVTVTDYRELVGLNTPEDIRWAEEIYGEIHEG
jgi:bifunctional N-acetylglucosamine-1-phosphate-uridyltransferase/glucosamine-1-phosphate-acetyltransferase GlmU-like protein